MELLSPAGSIEALYAAFRNGADAVYLGGRMFNARRNAANFDDEALAEVCRYAHERGKRVYVTVNIMVKEREMKELEAFIRILHDVKADGLIVTDLGVIDLIRSIAPDMHLHASTQMAVHNAAGVRYMKSLGFTRVVLAREMTLDEIRRCAREGVELEVFGHGALCSATSGQCLFSSLVGGRSGNRGMCAQPCRMKYLLKGNGFEKDGYMLSTRDLNTLDIVKELEEAGVASLKLEGRMKRPEYVAVITDIYRRVLDGKQPDGEDLAELKQMFNRGGFTGGYLKGVSDGNLTYTDRPNHIGVQVGAFDKGAILLGDDVSEKDALVLRTAETEEDQPVRLSGYRGQRVRPEARLRGGEKLIRLVSDKQMKAAAASFEKEKQTIPLTACLTLETGKTAVLTVSDEKNTVTAEGEAVTAAKNAPVTAEKAEIQLNKTGDTPYYFEKTEFSIAPDAFYAASGLNALRRAALETLSQKRIAAFDTGILRQPETKGPSGKAEGKRLLTVQSDDFSVLETAARNGADEVIFCPPSVTEEKLNALDLPETFCLAIPAVLDDDSLETLNRWAWANQSRITACYHSNLSHFALSWPGEKRADYPMNAANDRFVRFLEDNGAARYTPSVELNLSEIAEMGGRKELILFGRVTMMYLRHCPVNASLGGGPHEKCRRCEGSGKNLSGAALTDKTGAVFPLKRMEKLNGCVVRVLNSAVLMPLRRMNRLPDAQAYRLIFEDAEKPYAGEITRLYRAFLDGETAKDRPEWTVIDQLETTNGHFYRGVE